MDKDNFILMYKNIILFYITIKNIKMSYFYI